MNKTNHEITRHKDARTMYKNHTNFGGAALIILIAIAAVAGTAVLYFASPVIEQRVTGLWEDELTWSPRQIRRDPEGFVRHGIRQAEAIAGRAEEINIAARQAYIRNHRLLDDAVDSLDAAARVFNGLTDVYRTAEATDTWPAVFQDVPYAEDALREQIVGVKEKYDGLTSEVSRRTAARDAYRERVRDTERAQRDALAMRERLTERVQQVQLAQADLSLEELRDIEALIGELVGITKLSAVPSPEALIDAEQKGKGAVPFEELLDLRL